MHAWDEEHRVDWKGADIESILDKDEHYWKRKVLEAMHLVQEDQQSSYSSYPAFVTVI